MTPEQTEQERAEFEAWAKSAFIHINLTLVTKKDGTSEYAGKAARHMFEGWLARAEQTGWISVDDSLPETEGYVIVAWANGYVELSRFTRDKYSHGGSWHPDFIPDDITHWQPLPQPPEGATA